MEQGCSTPHHNQRLYRFYDVTPFTFFSHPLRLPLPCRQLQKPQRLPVIPSPSNIKQTRWIVIVLSYLLGGTAGARLLCYERALMQSSGERHGNGTWTWTPRIRSAHKVRKHSTAPWFQIKGQRYIRISPRH